MVIYSCKRKWHLNWPCFDKTLPAFLYKLYCSYVKKQFVKGLNLGVIS